MVDIRKLSPGMKVKIVDEWLPNRVCWEVPSMNKWRGQIMTVKKIYGGYVTMIEDQDEFKGWQWPSAAIDRIVYDDEMIEYDMYVANEDELLSLFAEV